jgi:hypothetical protein
VVGSQTLAKGCFLVSQQPNEAFWLIILKKMEGSTPKIK